MRDFDRLFKIRFFLDADADNPSFAHHGDNRIGIAANMIAFICWENYAHG
jgi:hypothetical protein